AEVVPPERIRRVDGHRLLVSLTRFVPPPGLLKDHAPLVPEFRIPRLPLEELGVEIQGGLGLPLQEIDLRHALLHRLFVFAGLEREPVPPERLDDITPPAKSDRP